MASQYDAEVALNASIRANPLPWLGLMRARQNRLEDQEREFAEKQHLLETKLRFDASEGRLDRAARLEQAQASATAMLDRYSQMEKQKLRHTLMTDTGLSPNEGEDIDSFIIRASREKDKRSLNTWRSYQADEDKIRGEIMAHGVAERARRENAKNSLVNLMFDSSPNISPEDKAAILTVRNKKLTAKGQPIMSHRSAAANAAIKKDRLAEVLSSLDAIEAAADQEAAKVPKEVLQAEDDLRGRLQAAEKQRATFSATPGGQRGMELFFQERGLHGQQRPLSGGGGAGGAPIDRSVGASGEALLQRPVAGPGGQVSPAAPGEVAPGAADQPPTTAPAGRTDFFTAPSDTRATGIIPEALFGYQMLDSQIGQTIDDAMTSMRSWPSDLYNLGVTGLEEFYRPPGGFQRTAPPDPAPPPAPSEVMGSAPYRPPAQAAAPPKGPIGGYPYTHEVAPTPIRAPQPTQAQIVAIWGDDAPALLAEATKLSDSNGVSPEEQAATFRRALGGDPVAQNQVAMVLDYLRQSKRPANAFTPNFQWSPQIPGPPPGGWESYRAPYNGPAISPAR